MLVRPIFVLHHGGLPDSPAAALSSMYRPNRCTAVALGPISTLCDARIPRERLIVYWHLVSHVTHFFVFGTRRSNSGCGSGGHKDGRRCCSRPMTSPFHTHASWLDPSTRQVGTSKPLLILPAPELPRLFPHTRQNGTMSLTDVGQTKLTHVMLC